MLASSNYTCARFFCDLCGESVWITASPPKRVQSTTIFLKALRCSTPKCDDCFKNANAVFASSVSISDLRITVETWVNCLSTTVLRFDPSVSMAFFMKVVAWRRRLVIIARPICEVQISVVGWEIARKVCCWLEPQIYGRCSCCFFLCISIRAQAMCLQSIFANGIKPRKPNILLTSIINSSNVKAKDQ